MFRRRAMMRPLRRAMMTPDVHPLLRRANDLMAQGDYPAAAEAFEQLARGAEARGIPRAPHLYLRAGQAHILANQVEAGMAHLKRGLSMMAAAGQGAMLQNSGQRIADELNERGLTKEAQEIEAYLKTLPTAPGGSAVAGPAKRLALPTHCPGCGGPLRADELAWLDEVTAECSYCGSPVRGE